MPENIRVGDQVDWNTVPDDAVLELGNYVAFWVHVKSVMREVGMEINTRNIRALILSTIQVVENKDHLNTNGKP